MALIHSNQYLEVRQMRDNALYIWTKLRQAGWTENAIAGILGNMESESTMNPGLFENRDYGNMTNGYGLVQWTPASKYFNWSGTTPATDNIERQIDRLLYEVKNNIQWLNSQDPKKRTFKQFTQSTDSPYDLAMAFITAYERPKNPNQPNRGQQALYWFNELTGQSWEGGGVKPQWPTTEGLPITSAYGWRTHPKTGLPDFHGAIDIGGGVVNHPIYATQDGVVVVNGFGNSPGNYIIIQHTSDPYYSKYLHLASPSPISVGTRVSRGQVIGTMGTTGSSTGIHLHFEITISQDWANESNSIDPEIYLEMEFGGGGQTPQEDYILTLGRQFIRKRRL